MTRPKGDSDPWLTDPIARDKVVAKTVVAGIREVIVLLRAIRDEGAETRALRAENRELRDEIRQLWQVQAGVPLTQTQRQRDWPQCEEARCSLPAGHSGNHRGAVQGG